MCQELDANQSLVDGETSTINTSENERVELRNRLVAREIKHKRTHNYIAKTPSSALVRYVTSRAATLSKTGKRRQLMVLDVKRAFLHADTLSETYVKPPHLRDAKRCWLLKKCMYGTLPTSNTLFRKLVQTLACSAQAIVQTRLDTHSEILVQKARLAPGCDNEATVLNRCVVYNESGLT